MKKKVRRCRTAPRFFAWEKGESVTRPHSHLSNRICTCSSRTLPSGKRTKKPGFCRAGLLQLPFLEFLRERVGVLGDEEYFLHQPEALGLTLEGGASRILYFDPHFVMAFARVDLSQNDRNDLRSRFDLFQNLAESGNDRMIHRDLAVKTSQIYCLTVNNL